MELLRSLSFGYIRRLVFFKRILISTCNLLNVFSLPINDHGLQVSNKNIMIKHSTSSIILIMIGSWITRDRLEHNDETFHLFNHSDYDWFRDQISDPVGCSSTCFAMNLTIKPCCELSGSSFYI